jgi:hypothetical protein
MSLQVLGDYLNQGLCYRNPNQLFVSQGVLTPSMKTVALRPFSTLEKSVCDPCNAFLGSILQNSISAKNIRINYHPQILYKFPTKIIIHKIYVCNLLV